MKTKSFRIVVGIEAGYEHDVAGVANNEAVKYVAVLWQELAAEEFEKSGVYVATVTSPGAVVYHRDWGCPEGGESVAILSGSANPQFIPDADKYREAVLRIAKKLKVELKQSTLSVEFWESDYVYLTD